MDEVVPDDDPAQGPVEPGVERSRIGRVVGATVNLVVLEDVVVTPVEESVARGVMDRIVGDEAADHSLVPFGIVHQTGRVDRR